MRPVNALVAIALLYAGIGVVRPQSARLAEEAWDPVLASSQEVRLEDHEEVELTQSGEFIVFVDGPSGHPVWEREKGWYIDFYDVANRPISATTEGIDKYAYDRTGRRGDAVVKLRVQAPGSYRLRLGQDQSPELSEAGFSLALCQARLVDDQSMKSRGLRYGGFGLVGLLGLIALSMLTSKG